jgi:hypothetical protein
MPGMMDRTVQIHNELRTTRRFAEEIEAMPAPERAAALTDLLPALEKAVNLSALQAFNEKARQWIDAHPQP